MVQEGWWAMLSVAGYACIGLQRLEVGIAVNATMLCGGAGLTSLREGRGHSAAGVGRR